ncbi:MAG: glutathione S-transferase family protein [Bdellovibrionaceae bacterium]|nr:glutathione S-transferase family protein [Pseudobdellovibrionaceae bacterium]MBX3033939.1 glutathione S-transferase family protein [Pseudobdellovibrionaceae bacterium]
MVTLHTYGPLFDLVDASPFVIKAHLLLRMAKVEYKPTRQGLNKAPKGKLPYINDNGTLVADSSFIRWHLEKTRGLDFDAHLSASDKAVAWAFQKMTEEHLYWGIVDARWLVPENFRKGPATLFKGLPFFLRPFIERMVAKSLRKSIQGHGMGRHARADIEALAKRDLQALSDFLGNKPYFMGEKISGVDATVFAFVLSAQCAEFTTPIGDFARGLPNLVAYVERIRKEYFPA